MKKALLGALVLLLCACSLGMANTPKEKTKEFLDKYKNQDQEVLSDLDNIVSSEYSGDYATRYKTLMTNQYKDLEYEIVDEIIEGDTATVVAKIKVYNYSSAINSANTYLSENQNEFMLNASDETTNDPNNTITNTIDNDKFLDYKFGLLESISDKVTYTIDFSFRKENGKWIMESLNETDIEKIHGLYSE